MSRNSGIVVACIVVQ